MAGYRITPRAYEDLKQIGRYTEKNWGRQQRNNYLRKLTRHFEILAITPEIGRHRPDITQGYFSFPVGQHVIFYQLDHSGITVLGLPHQQMDIKGYFVDPQD